MIASLLQLDVDFGKLRSFHRARVWLGKDSQVLAVDTLVISLLDAGEPDLTNGLLEGRYRKLDFVLHSAQELWPKHRVQFLDLLGSFQLYVVGHDLSKLLKMSGSM